MTTVLRLIPYDVEKEPNSSSDDSVGRSRNSTSEASHITTRRNRRTRRMRLANSDSTVPGLPSSVSENSPESSHERISNPSRTASTVSSSTIEVPRLPTPPSLDNDGRKLVADLEAAIEASRAAETLHAYDVGVCAALESMAKHWNAQAAQFHTSNSEKRIFQREAQRLEDLIIRAQQQVHVGDRRLILKRAEEKRLWAEVEKTQGARGDAINATVDRLVENTERMRLEGGPDKELFSRAAGMLSDTERDLESGGEMPVSPGD